MKKILIAILLIGVISSCTERNVKTSPTKIVIEIGDDPLEIVTIEGCEYFKTYTAPNYFTLVHKGNCKSPIHKGGNK
jgi:hypothetical protein